MAVSDGVFKASPFRRLVSTFFALMLRALQRDGEQAAVWLTIDKADLAKYFYTQVGDAYGEWGGGVGIPWVDIALACMLCWVRESI